jgi:hypothetical protein
MRNPIYSRDRFHGQFTRGRTDMQVMQALIELIVIVGGFFLLIFLCAASSYGKGRASGKIEITRPSDKKVDGFGGAQALDYTHAPPFRTSTQAGMPVSLRLEREKTETHKMSKGDEEEEL